MISRSSPKGEISPEPLGRNEDRCADANQEIDVGHAPEPPSKVQARALVAHDSYERLLEIPCTPAARPPSDRLSILRQASKSSSLDDLAWAKRLIL